MIRNHTKSRIALCDTWSVRGESSIGLSVGGVARENTDAIHDASHLPRIMNRLPSS